MSTPRIGALLCGVARSYDVVILSQVSELRFEWDQRKDAENHRKHGVSFEEARTVFFDDRALLRNDPDEDEERFVLLGFLRS